MQLLDGKLISKQYRQEIATKVKLATQAGRRAPHLAAVLIGDHPASQAYVKNKIKACDEVGFSSTLIKKNASITQAELMELIHQLNNNDELDGYIVQLPLPHHINEQEVTLAIEHTKDVDGFHPVNFGRMAQGLPAYLPATPMGIMMILKKSEIPTSGKDVVVVGRSNIVGTPMSILLSRKSYPGDATVTLVHSRTHDMSSYTKRADILIAAIGIPKFIKAEMVKDGCVVIDVGINRIEENGKGILVGDVDFEHVAPKCSFITPVPGGVGPMTITALIANTWKSYNKEIYI